MIKILRLHLLLVCFSVVKVVEVGNNDRHWESDREHPGNGTQGPDYLPPDTDRPAQYEQWLVTSSLHLSLPEASQIYSEIVEPTASEIEFQLNGRSLAEGKSDKSILVYLPFAVLREMEPEGGLVPVNKYTHVMSP